MVVSEEKLELQEEVKSLQQRNASLTAETTRLHDQLRQMTLDKILDDKVHEILVEKAKSVHAPLATIEMTRELVRSDLQLKQLETQMVEDMRKLTELAVDSLVEAEADYEALKEAFEGVSFEKKEEIGESIAVWNLT
jgi:predicted nuclease with TOPRIM domain